MKLTKKTKARAKTVKAITNGSSEPAAAEVQTTNGTDEVVTAEVRQGSQHTTEQIRQRAYELFLARGATHGNDVRDWLLAEQELRAPM
jgi:CHASE3 domain sensor protein